MSGINVKRLYEGCGMHFQKKAPMKKISKNYKKCDQRTDKDLVLWTGTWDDQEEDIVEADNLAEDIVEAGNLVEKSSSHKNLEPSDGN